MRLPRHGGCNLYQWSNPVSVPTVKGRVAMKMRKILFPTDFSPSSEAALEVASALANDSGAALLIVHVEEAIPSYGVGDMYFGTVEPDTKALWGLLNRVAPTRPGVFCERQLLRGDAATSIVQFAEDEECDLIVMGTHGRSGLGRLLMGSVAEAVVRRAKCPVLTVKKPLRELRAGAATAQGKECAK